MGMLGGFLQGLGQGIGTIGNAAMVGAQEQQRTAARRLERAEDFQREKQMMLERIRASEESAARMRQAELDFNTNPTNVGKVTAAAGTTARAAAETQDEIAAKRLDPNSPLYQAQVADEARKAAAGTRRRIDEQTQMLSNPALVQAQRDKAAGDAAAQATSQMDIAKRMAADTEFLKAQERIALADPKAKAQIEASRAAAASSYASAANSKANADQTRLQTESMKRIDGIYAEMLKTVDDKTLTPEQRAQKLSGLQTKLSALTPGKRDPELDTQTVTEEKVNQDGSTTKTTRKEVRRPGAGGAAAGDAPYPDGTELRGKDGNVYVVRGGQPVLKDGTKPAAPKQGAPKPAGVASSEIESAEKIQQMDPDTFRAYQNWKEGQPTSPRDRQLLRAAGFKA